VVEGLCCYITEIVFIVVVVQQNRRVPAAEYMYRPNKVCMTKINHFGIGSRNCVMTDDIVGSVCDSQTAPFSKMAAINTITHNKVIEKSKVWHIVHQNPHFRGQGMQW